MAMEDIGIDAAPGDTIETWFGEYTLPAWERCVGGILTGPGYAFDLRSNDILFFASPSFERRTR